MGDQSLALIKMLEAIQFYREIGFFTRFGELTNEDIVKKLDEETDGSYYFNVWDELYGFNRCKDLELLWCGKERVLWFDRELSLEEIILLIDRLAEVSLGLFQPEEVNISKMTDISEGNAYLITYILGGIQSSIEIKKQGFLDLELLEKINSTIKDSGYRFEIAQADQMAYVLFLNIAQRDQMEKERGISFF